jgi:hypothetical protein
MIIITVLSSYIWWLVMVSCHLLLDCRAYYEHFLIGLIANYVRWAHCHHAWRVLRLRMEKKTSRYGG